MWLQREALKLSSRRWGNVMKALLSILDLVESDPDVYEPVSSFSKFADINSRTIVVTALDQLGFVIELQSCTSRE